MTADNSNNVANYGWEEAENPNSCNYITPQLIQILKSLGLKRVADLGSGNGSLCGTLCAEGFDTVGIEYDPQGFNISVKSYPSVKFYNLGVQDNPNLLLENESKFDAVVSTEVIEHLYSPHLLPTFSSSILKEGGYLIVSTPYHGYLKNLALSLANHWDIHHTPLWHGGHIKFWSKVTLSKLLSDAGFNVTEFYGVGRFPLLWKSMILVAQKRQTTAT